MRDELHGKVHKTLGARGRTFCRTERWCVLSLFRVDAIAYKYKLSETMNAQNSGR